MSNYFTAQQEAKLRFFKLPKALYFEEQYKGLSLDAKMLYAILKDRNSLSIKNNWIDEEGRIYFIFRLNKKTSKNDEVDVDEDIDENDNLTETLGWSKPTIIKRLKELEKFDLLEVKKQFNNKPNLMYLKDVKVENPSNYFDDSYRRVFYNFLEDNHRKRFIDLLELQENSTDFNILNKLSKESLSKQHEILGKVLDVETIKIQRFMNMVDTCIEDDIVKCAKNSISYFKYLIKVINTKS